MEIWLTNNEVKKMSAQVAATKAVGFMVSCLMRDWWDRLSCDHFWSSHTHVPAETGCNQARIATNGERQRKESTGFWNDMAKPWQRFAGRHIKPICIYLSIYPFFICQFLFIRVWVAFSRTNGSNWTKWSRSPTPLSTARCKWERSTARTSRTCAPTCRTKSGSPSRPRSVGWLVACFRVLSVC